MLQERRSHQRDGVKDALYAAGREVRHRGTTRQLGIIEARVESTASKYEPPASANGGSEPFTAIAPALRPFALVIDRWHEWWHRSSAGSSPLEVTRRA